jgi:hypothetical protein
MDEDQQEQEEQQQEQQQIAPSAFTTFSRINPVSRRPLSALTLFNRQQLETNEETRDAIRKNQQAITTLNLSLTNVTGQVAQLTASLNKISQEIVQSTTLENLRQAQLQKQEAMLADQNIRSGKEAQIEKGIQSALFAPVQRIGAKTQFTLSRLMNFFNVLLGTLLTGAAIKLIIALTSGNQEGLKGIGDGIMKGLTAAGGIFLAINGGLTLAIRSLTGLAGFLTRVAVTNLLIRPIQLVFNIASSLAAALTSGALSTTGKITTPKTSTPKNLNKFKGKRFSRLNSFIPDLIAAGITINEIRSGERVDRALSGLAGYFVGDITTEGIGIALQRRGTLKSKILGGALRVFSPLVGEFVGRPAGKQGFDLLTQSMGLNLISGNPQTDGDFFNQNISSIKSNNINVITADEQPQGTITAEGRAALLMFAPPSNPNNPYILNSHVQYNVLPV